MKKDRGKQILKKEDYEKFEWHDTRYFGLFYKKVKQEDRIVIKDIKVDIKRFLNTTGHKFNETQLNIINKRQTHYFYPKKNDYCDYMCNVFNDRLDKLTEYWNFIKHNSKSTYDKIKESYPEFLFENAEFIQGQPAYKFIRFSDELVMELLNGCREFFKEYCLLVFSENYDEAQWNYGRYFFDIVKDSQDMVLNPLGLPWYL